MDQLLAIHDAAPRTHVNDPREARALCVPPESRKADTKDLGGLLRTAGRRWGVKNIAVAGARNWDIN
jgi:hypothetical protein